MTSSDRCGACGSPKFELWLERACDYITGAEFSVRRCMRCGLGHTEPEPAAMDRYYPVRYRKYGGLTLKALRALYGRRVRGWLRHLPAQGQAFEVGCGEGWMLRALRDRGWRVVGSERSTDGARAAVAANGIPMFVGDLTALGAGRFDLVILFQVLEHLSDPFAALRDGANLLAPRGVMVVAVPNAASWQARTFGRFWFHLDVPRHLQHFSPDALSRALQNVGLKIVRTRVVSPEHDPYGVLQSWLNWLGFRQNLLTKVLMGMGEEASVASVALMTTVAAILFVPSIMISLAGWASGSGAILEMWAAKA
jgi:2-polyprenyl-3-methyl-5-hydroxy-6-metoxy-1,4-benzoquinol methylase